MSQRDAVELSFENGLVLDAIQALVGSISENFLAISLKVDLLPESVIVYFALAEDEEAREIYETMLATRNPLGLLSEDTDVRTGELWGNFPQTYSMVGIINGAVRLSRGWHAVI